MSQAALIAVFIRADGFYPREQAAEHSAVNPGTLRVEDIRGNALWESGGGNV